MSEPGGDDRWTAPNDAPQPPLREKAAPEGKWAKLSAVAAIVGAIGTWVAVQTSSTSSAGDQNNPASSPTVATSAAEQTPQSQQPTDSAVPRVARVGVCVDTSGAETDCAGPHAGQVVAVGGACEPETVRAFSGMSERDVLRPDIEMVMLSAEGCSFSLIGGTSLNGSVEDAFSDPRSDVASQLRHCLDVDLNPTGCDASHHGEVVGVVSAGESCQDVAADFMGWNASSLPAGIALSTRGQECLVTVKGSNVLTSTLRDIGRRALPIEPSP